MDAKNTKRRYVEAAEAAPAAYQSFSPAGVEAHACADESPTVESDTLIRCLRGEPQPHIRNYRVLTKYLPNQTLVLVLDSDRLVHKYLLAKDDDGHEFLLVVPMELVWRDTQMFSRICLSTHCEVRCQGGGFVTVGSKVIVHGRSIEYGAGDHAHVREAVHSLLVGLRQVEGRL